MKISNSKKQLAKTIHENGGWRDGMSFSWYGNKTGKGYFGKLRPRFDKVSGSMIAYGGLGAGFVPFECKKLPNWHQTILSRDEYFHLYPAPDADVVSLSSVLGLVTDENKHEHVDSKPTIEQLAADYRNAKDYADRKQQEADAAKSDAEVKLAELVAAGKAHGLVLSVADTRLEPGITDWRDLLVGDEVECVRTPYGAICTPGMFGVVTEVTASGVRARFDASLSRRADGSWFSTQGGSFRFIRRPAKGDANA